MAKTETTDHRPQPLPKRRNPPDATLRNVQSYNKRFEEIENRVRKIEKRMRKLQKKV